MGLGFTWQQALAMVFICGLINILITVVLMLLKVKGSILIGILATTFIGMFMGVTQIPDLSTMNFGIPSLEPTFFKLDIKGLFADPSKVFFVITTIFAFSLSDTFDTIGTFLGTGSNPSQTKPAWGSTLGGCKNWKFLK